MSEDQHGCAGAKVVLIVDDDPIIHRTTSMKLQAAGYQVLNATDGSEAIALLKQHTPDIILLDFIFPPDDALGGISSWDGLRLMHWMRTLKGAEHARFIIITGEDATSLRRKPLALGAAAIFQKPIDHKQLLETIAQELNPRPEENALAQARAEHGTA
jgi:CheY-like chemotaxis protein